MTEIIRERVGGMRLPSRIELIAQRASTDAAARKLLQDYFNKVCSNFMTEYKNTLALVPKCWTVSDENGVETIECILVPNPRLQEIIEEALAFGCKWPIKEQQRISELYKQLKKD